MKVNRGAITIVKVFTIGMGMLLLISTSSTVMDRTKNEISKALKTSELSQIIELKDIFGKSQGKFVMPTNVGRDLKKLFSFDVTGL